METSRNRGGMRIKPYTDRPPGGDYRDEEEEEEDNVEYDVCRIKRDWGPGEEGSLISHNMAGEMDTEKRDIPFFTKLYTLAQILGILTVVLVGVWCGSFRGGFAWTSDPGHQFNWHPFLMTLGLVFLYANGALIYRGFRYEKKKKLKLMHMLIMLAAFVLSIIGLVAVFDFHNAMGIPNMYSLHSWMGMATVLLFAFQWVAGFLTFLFPGLRASVRSTYMPVHQFFGLFIFVGAVSTSLLGLTEKAFFSLKDEKGNPTYKDLPDEGVLINITGLVFILFAGLVVYLTATAAYKRQTTEDEVLLTDTVLE